MWKRYLSYLSFPLAVFLFHCVLTLVFDAYDRIEQLDTGMHFLGGIAIAHFISHTIIQLDRSKILSARSPITFFLLVFGLVAASTVMWEFAEFITDYLFDMNIQVSVTNLMKDQFLGIVGGLVYVASFRPDRQI